jgi:hypothetical protein
MSATTERQTVTRIDIEHAIDAREDAWTLHLRAVRDYAPDLTRRTTDAYVAACAKLRELLDRWENQLRGWEEGA